MAITSAIVLYAVIWTLTFFVALPIRLTTQGDAGKVEPGTHAGAPQVHHLRKKALITTVVALGIWAIVVVIVLSGWISVRDIDWFGRMEPQG
jgi:predicted secreted protein